MNKRIIIALAALVLFVVLVLWLFDSGGSSSSSKNEIYHNWETEYDFRSKEPQDLALFKNLLQAHTKDSFYIVEKYEQLKTIKRLDSCTFLFISNDLYMDQGILAELTKHVYAGSNMFLSFETINAESYPSFFEPNALSWEYNDKFYQWVGDTSLCYSTVYQNDTLTDDWYIFNEENIRDTAYKAYMFAVNKPTAFYLKLGKGKMHFHTNPKLFKNYQVVTRNGYAHAAAILKYVPKNRPVVVLAFALPPKEEPFDPFNQGDGELQRDNSYLQFIIQNDALRTAFFFVMGLIALFIIFRTKRKENVIEGLAPKRNMSIAFVETLSSIYLSKNSPIGVLQLMRRNFYTQVNRYFYIDLHRPEKREENIQRLIEKTGYPAEDVKELVRLLDPRKNEVNNAHLGLVYRKINEFYRKTGVRKEYDKVFIAGKKLELHRSALIGGTAFLFAMMIFLKGLQLLIMGGGTGIVVAMVGSFLLFLTARLILVPVLVVNDEQLIYNKLIWGKTILNIKESINTTVHKTHTEFASENSGTIRISNGLLSKRSKYALNQIIEHIKRKTA